MRNVCVSIYEEANALYAASLPVNDIQVQYSLLEQRLHKTDFFQLARQNAVTVFARSAFLHGLLFMEYDRNPEHLAEARDHLHMFDTICKKYALSRLQTALLFSYANKH